MNIILRKTFLAISILILTVVIACGGDAETVIPDPGEVVEKVKDKIEKAPEEPKEEPKEEVKKDPATEPKEEKKVAKAEKVEKVEVEKVEVKKEEEVAIEDLLEEKGIESIEQPPLTLAILEGAAEFKVSQDSEWVSGFDAQPIEQGWSVRTLNVSSAVLNYPDGSMVLLEPNTEVAIELFQIINGGPEDGGERHAQVRLVDGDIDFDVTSAPSPPSTWAFLTADGAVTIQGTGGSLARTIDINEEGDLKVDYSADLLEGTATMVRMGQDENEEQTLQAVVIQPGVTFEVTETKDLDNIENDPVLAADVAKAVELELPVPLALQDTSPPENLKGLQNALQTAALGGPDGVEVIKETGSVAEAVKVTQAQFEEEATLDISDLFVPQGPEGEEQGITVDFLEDIEYTIK